MPNRFASLFGPNKGIKKNCYLPETKIFAHLINLHADTLEQLVLQNPTGIMRKLFNRINLITRALGEDMIEVQFCHPLKPNEYQLLPTIDNCSQTVRLYSHRCVLHSLPIVGLWRKWSFVVRMIIQTIFYLLNVQSMYQFSLEGRHVHEDIFNTQIRVTSSFVYLPVLLLCLQYVLFLINLTLRT